MTKLAWTPWRKVVKIRPNLKSGELSLNIFADDEHHDRNATAGPSAEELRCVN